MKNLLLSAFVLLLLLPSCEETAPVIPPLSTGNRKVLIEEFTGVRCVNCPDGSKEIENLLAAFPENLIAVSIHAGIFSFPYPQSRFDFRTADGTALESFLGTPLGYPSAVINRKQFSGQSMLQLPKSIWGGVIQEEIQTDPILNILLEKDYDENSRLLNVNVRIIPAGNFTQPAKISLMLTEDNVMDLQLTPSSSDPKPDYIHRHVFREMLTKFDGDPIETPLVAGSEVNLDYSILLPTDYVAENCYVVAFVHRADGNKEVIQANDIHVVE